MPFQLTPNRVTYDDGVGATTEQEARDVVAFLAWSAEPHADERKNLGRAVMIYLLIFTGVLYVSYRTIWRGRPPSLAVHSPGLKAGSAPLSGSGEGAFCCAPSDHRLVIVTRLCDTSGSCSVDRGSEDHA